MKRNRHLQTVVGIMTVLTFFWVSTIEAVRPIRVCSPPRRFSQTRPFQIFTQHARTPDLAIIQKIYQKIPWNSLGLSEEQHSRIQKTFHEFWVNSLEIQQELERTRQKVSFMNPTTPDEQVTFASLQTKMTTLEQGLAKRFALYFAAIKKILTPEQRKKMRKFKTSSRMLYKVRTQFQYLLPAQGTPLVKTVLQAQSFIHPDEHVGSEQIVSHTFVQNLSDSSSTQYLHQLQILRL